MTLRELETKVLALEEEVQRLKAQLEQDAKPKGPWWVTEAGRFADDPAYDEAMRLGREYRESLRPPEVKKAKKPRAKKHART